MAHIVKLNYYILLKRCGMKKNKYEIVKLTPTKIKDLDFITKYQEIDNLCKKETFPYMESYFGFKNHTNTWFFDSLFLRNYKKVNLSLIQEISLSIIKKCDSDTSLILYNHNNGKKYGELRISIFNYEDHYKLQSVLTGINCDFIENYELWFDGEIDDLFIISIEIMKWINKQSIINGKDFLKYCMSL